MTIKKVGKLQEDGEYDWCVRLDGGHGNVIDLECCSEKDADHIKAEICHYIVGTIDEGDAVEPF